MTETTKRTRPQIAVRPAAVAAVNTATLIAADAVAVAGTVALLPIAGAVVVGGVGLVARKMRARTRATSSKRTAKAARPSRSAGPRSGLLARRAEKRAAANAAPKKAAPRKPGPLDKASQRIAATTAGKKLAALDRKAATAARKATAPTRRAATAAKERRKAGRDERAEKKKRTTVDPAVVKAKKPSRADRKKTAKQSTQPAAKKAKGLKTTVPPAAGATPKTTAAKARPAAPNPAPAVRAPQTAPIQQTTTGVSTMAATMRQIIDLAEQMQSAAARYEPTGMLEVLDDYGQMPQALDAIAAALGTFHRKAEDSYPLKPVILELIASTHRHQISTARASDEIAPTIMSIHRREIEALDDARNKMWDHARNQGK